MPTLIDELKNTPQENLAEVYLNLQKFVIHLHRPLLNSTSVNSKMAASAKQLLFNTCFDNIPLPEIAASLGYSYENFRKIFKAETGLPPLQYSDPYIFSKQFKKYIGQSPSACKPSAAFS